MSKLLRLHSSTSGTSTTPPRTTVVTYAAASNGGPNNANANANANRSSGSLLTLFSQNPLQFGPRLVAGALSTVLEEGIAAPQRDLERLQLIVNSDADDKQEQIVAEIEDRISQFVSLGTEKESELMASLPLPDGIREMLQTGEAGASGGRSKPLATWTVTTSTDTMDGVEEVDEYVTPEVTASGQAASELSQIQAAVAVLRENIEALKTNEDDSKVGLLKLNIREAASTVRQKLDQQQMTTGSSDVNSALMEAKALLTEVETL